MTKWQAFTESGTFYLGNNGSVSVSSERSGSLFFHNARLKSIPAGVLETWDRIDWKYLEGLPFVGFPTVGERLFTSDLNQWRISTPMKIVEVLH